MPVVSFRPLVVAIVLVGVLGAAGCVSDSPSSVGSRVPTITTEELSVLMVTDATEASTDQTVLSSETTARRIKRSTAIAIAREAIGRTDSDVRFLHGHARRTATDAATSAWIVLFAGGEAIGGMPSGAPVRPRCCRPRYLVMIRQNCVET